ncbi:MAG: hypothetical protein EA383_13745 [Spirochaetaceae bacterium]|nr:MAG: hypothetical protein EA383_13745 [Spirochaetaceae bacterium]
MELRLLTRVLKTACVLCFVLGTHVHASGFSRVALIIGNSNYEVQPLANPINDATDMAAMLESLGFEVFVELDATRGGMERAVRAFVDAVERHNAETALFYYAGHAVQFEGVNYLLPVNANIRDSFELLDQALSMDRVTVGLERSGTEFNLVMLDACRDNPFSTTRSASRGLSVMGGGGRGSMVVFATAPGDVADDGAGQRNSPFTQALLRHIATPGLEVRQIVTEVQRGVQQATGGRQIPWVNTSFTGEFYFTTAEEQLARSRSQARELEAELAALEAEIAERAQAIQGAASAEERRRLDGEQQAARAREEANRLQAERLAEIERQAAAALEQQRAQAALRQEMEAQLSAQQASLSRQAEQRRAELDRLRLETAGRDGFFERLTTIAQINATIPEIELRFDGIVTSTLAELNTLHRQQIVSYEDENTPDPWETSEEYETRIERELLALEASHEREITRQRDDLLTRKTEEIQRLQEELETVRGELNGARFTVGAEAIEVVVDELDPYRREFPITVRVTDERLPFAVSAPYRIQGTERDTIRDEYFRVFSADRAGGLSGELEYSMHEVLPNLWAIRVVETRVVNLLEGDTVLATVGSSRTTEPVSTSAGRGEILYMTDGEVQRVGAAVVIMSSHGSANVVRGETVLGQTDYLYTTPGDSTSNTGRLTLEWEDGQHRTFTFPIQPGMNPPVLVDRSGERTNALRLVHVYNLHPSIETSIGRDIHTVRTFAEGSVTYLTDGHAVRFSGAYLFDPAEISLSERLSGGDAAVRWIDAAALDSQLTGRLRIASVGDIFTVYDAEGQPVETRTGQSSTAIQLRPGQYEVAFRQPEDPYYAHVEHVTVEPATEVHLDVADVGLSAQYRLEQAEAAQLETKRLLSRNRRGRTYGWTLIGTGLSGFAVSALSYLQVQHATTSYNEASTTAAALQHRQEVEQWGTGFTVSAGVGISGSVIGSLILRRNRDRTSLEQQQDEINRRIAALREEISAQRATSVVLGRGGN